MIFVHIIVGCSGKWNLMLCTIGLKMVGCLFSSEILYVTVIANEPIARNQSPCDVHFSEMMPHFLKA